MDIINTGPPWHRAQYWWPHGPEPSTVPGAHGAELGTGGPWSREPSTVLGAHGAELGTGGPWYGSEYSIGIPDQQAAAKSETLAAL